MKPLVYSGLGAQRAGPVVYVPQGPQGPQGQPSQPAYSNNVNFQTGEGFMDGFNRVINAGRRIGERAVDLYTGEVGTAIRNAIQGTHQYSSRAYPGEQHQILFHQGTVNYDPTRPADKFSTANYSGPKTALIKRLSNNVKPLTVTDATAKMHDINYALTGAKV